MKKEKIKMTREELKHSREKYGYQPRKFFIDDTQGNYKNKIIKLKREEKDENKEI